jgi:hypothetical protein
VFLRGLFTGYLREFGVGFDDVLGGFVEPRAVLLQALHPLGFIVRLSRLPALRQDLLRRSPNYDKHVGRHGTTSFAAIAILLATATMAVRRQANLFSHPRLENGCETIRPNMVFLTCVCRAVMPMFRVVSE